MGSMTKDWVISKTITKNKAFELQLSKDKKWDQHSLFYVSFSWTWKADHAGPEFRLFVGPITFVVAIYDIRHWDHENDRWDTAPPTGADRD